MTLLKGSNFIVSKPSIESPNKRKIGEISIKNILAKEDIGRLNSMFLILEKKCVKVVNNAGIIEIKQMESENGIFIDAKNITEISQIPK